MTTTGNATTGRRGLKRFLDRVLYEYARLAWVLGGVWDPSVVTLRRYRNQGTR